MRFLTIQEQALGGESAEVAVTVSRLADMHLKGGNLDDAQKLYQRALAIREKAIGPHNKELEESRQSLERLKALRVDPPANENDSLNMTRSSQAFFRPAKSEGVAESATGRVSASPGLETRATLWAVQQKNDRQKSDQLQFFSGTVEAQSPFVEQFPLVSGEYDALAFRPFDSSTSLEAIPETMLQPCDPALHAEEIKELRLEADLIRQVSGDDSTLLAECLTKLADLLCRSKRYSEMESHLIEALSIRERRLGVDHHLVSNSAKNLARLYYFEGKFAKARPLFERALLIRRKVFGSNNLKVADVLSQYAKLLRKMGSYDEAAIMEREAASIKSKHQAWRRY